MVIARNGALAQAHTGELGVRMQMIGNHNTVSRARIIVIFFLFFTSFGLLSILIGYLPTSLFSNGLTFTLGLVLTPILAAPIEWLVHRHLYHGSVVFLRRLHAIHKTHHKHFPPSQYVGSGSTQRVPILGHVGVAETTQWKNSLVYLAHVTFYLLIAMGLICVPAWLLSHNIPFLTGLILGTVTISNLFIIIHDTMHRPGSHKFIESQRWYFMLNKHHYLHHVDIRVNFNSLFPFADRLFGTLYKEISDSEVHLLPFKTPGSVVSTNQDPQLEKNRV